MEHLFLMFLDHTQWRSTVGRTPLDEWSARRRDLYLTTHDTYNIQISMPSVGFEPKISAGERPQAAHLLRFVCRHRRLSKIPLNAIHLSTLLCFSWFCQLTALYKIYLIVIIIIIIIIIKTNQYPNWIFMLQDKPKCAFPGKYIGYARIINTFF